MPLAGLAADTFGPRWALAAGAASGVVAAALVGGQVAVPGVAQSQPGAASSTGRDDGKNSASAAARAPVDEIRGAAAVLQDVGGPAREVARRGGSRSRLDYFSSAKIASASP